MQNIHQSVDVPLIINGKQVTTSSKFDIVSPETCEPCWTASSATTEDALKAVEAASKAYISWSRTKPIARRNILLKAAELIESRLDEHASFMRTEMGSDVGTSKHFVVPLAIRMLRDIANRITSVCGSVPVVEGEGQSAIVLKEPMGVILSIGPWCVV